MAGKGGQAGLVGCTVPLTAQTAFGGAAIRDWVPALQHISGRGRVKRVLVDLILCSRVLLAGGWTPLCCPWWWWWGNLGQWCSWDLSL